MQITSREREICELLRKEPLISQEDLAARLGITRSSVAVHISNLIKKGIILGKGYVFSQQAICTVIGEAAFLTQVFPGDPATIERRPEGLAIKACQALKSFDLAVKVFTCLGTDPEGDELLAILADIADVSGIIRSAGTNTRQWVKINRGEIIEGYNNRFSGNHPLLALEKANFPWLDCNFLWIEPEYLPTVLPVLKEAEPGLPRLVVCSTSKISEEAEVDIVVKGEKSERENVPGSGNNLVVATDGSHYVMARSPEEEVYINLLPGQYFNIDYDLERFTAGLVYGLSRGNQLRQALRIAIGNTAYQDNQYLEPGGGVNSERS